MNDGAKFYPIDANDAYPEHVGTNDKMEVANGAVYVHLNGRRAKLAGLQSVDFLISQLAAIRSTFLGPQAGKNDSETETLMLDDIIARALIDTPYSSNRKLISEHLAPIIQASLQSLGAAMTDSQRRDLTINEPNAHKVGIFMRAAVLLASKKWFYEAFEDELLEQMQKAGLIDQAEGFSAGIIATLQLDLEQAIDESLVAAEESEQKSPNRAPNGYSEFESLALDGWRVERNLDDPAFTDASNQRQRWSLKRSAAPYEFEDRQRIWFAPTFEGLTEIVAGYQLELEAYRNE